MIHPNFSDFGSLEFAIDQLHFAPRFALFFLSVVTLEFSNGGAFSFGFDSGSAQSDYHGFPQLITIVPKFDQLLPDDLSALLGLLQGDLESIMHSLAFHKSPDLSGANVFVGSVVDQFRPKNGLVQEFLNLRTVWVSPCVFDANAFGSFFPQLLALSVDLVVQGVNGL